jgi:hypothetical protein
LWLYAGLVGVLVAVRSTQIHALRRRLGPRRFRFDATGRRLVLEPYDTEGWGFDLARPAWPRTPLWWPAIAFLGWALLQLAPLPAAVVDLLSPGRGHVSTIELDRPHAFTIDTAASLRGLAFVVSMILFHLAGATLAEHSSCRRRFRAFVAWFGTALALIALFQVAVGARRIYGFFMPLDSPAFFGVFVNRNHFAAYMTLCAMAGLAVLYRALQNYHHHLGPRSNVRRRLVALGSPEGIRLIVTVVPVILTIGALIATTSRGGILSFLGALVLASVAIRRHQRHLPVGMFAFLLVLPLTWFGVERLEERFGRIRADESGRTAIWRHSVASMSGTWLTGAGLNTFPAAVSRVLPLAMPAGATAWPGEVAEARPARLRIGFRTPADLEGWQWYDEAHNDYVQLAVEMGAIGLGIGIWALIILAGGMHELWLASGVVGILMHSTVDFALQIPAVAVLFFVMCAYAERTPPSLTPPKR